MKREHYSQGEDIRFMAGETMGDWAKRDISDIRARRRKSRRRKPKLDACRAKILALRQAGASLDEIRLWLRKHRKILVHKSSICRALARWRE
jgi:hypothetical protein